MKEWKEGIFKKDEENDIKLFQDFFSAIGIWQWSAETEYGTFADVMCQDHAGHVYAVELKSRKNIYDTIYLEPKKFFNLRELSRYNDVVPIFLNFIDKRFYVCNLTRVSEPKLYFDVPIYGGKEKVDRIGIGLNDFCIYEYNGDKLLLKQDADVFNADGRKTWDIRGKKLNNTFLKSTWEKNE